MVGIGNSQCEEASREPCPFCSLPTDRILDEDSLSLVIRDGFPVAPGHTLIIPKRHVGSFFELTLQERSSMMTMLVKTHGLLRASGGLQDCNVGLNDGPAAGQTVPHVHIHLIPRSCGDVEDPRGGVRWVLPHKAKYWE
jgi:diadenosine tetraphosphate (Ap4A) HIT family hydrolase